MFNKNVKEEELQEWIDIIMSFKKNAHEDTCKQTEEMFLLNKKVDAILQYLGKEYYEETITESGLVDLEVCDDCNENYYEGNAWLDEDLKAPKGKKKASSKKKPLR